MGRKLDVEESLKDLHIKKIDGQLKDKELTKLQSELLAIVASILTTNGWGMHGHVGMICNEAEYVVFCTMGKNVQSNTTWAHIRSMSVQLIQ